MSNEKPAFARPTTSQYRSVPAIMKERRRNELESEDAEDMLALLCWPDVFYGNAGQLRHASFFVPDDVPDGACVRVTRKGVVLVVEDDYDA